MMYFDSESTTSPGNGLCCNVARDEVNLQKKRSIPLQHLQTIVLFRVKIRFPINDARRKAMVWRGWSGIDLFFWRLTSPRATLQRPFPGEVVIDSRAASKGSEGREFDTPGLKSIVSALIISHSDDSQACFVMFAPGL